ncbi:MULTISPECIES: substrate-binding domain-containing protein [unclassified Clostridium]|uniref:sugar ABC transporter substrate-binding protein n=1 Tax=unclassified Clostridium TaxID=2614128 RepID=UPI0002983807|nr:MULTISPECIES: substrate-binding domain-containing protein [unclassified Clostridium]EKQ53617.1 MAG: ABC-type xylose transport system, periplasmic component [Clostridium sp. Maddingley MBC34-26]
MYLSIPSSFLVPVCVAEDILNTEKIVELQECISSSYFINKPVNRKGLVIGVSLPNQRDERWIRDREAMEAYAKEKNVILKIEDAEYDVNKQISQVENLISQGIDVLILVAIDVYTAGGMVEKAKQAGVKVVAYEARILKTDLEIFVTFDHLMAGQLQGKFLITKVPVGNYIIMYADLPYDSSLRDGAMQYIDPLAIIGNIKIIAEKAIKNWDPKIAFEVVRDVLITNNDEVDAILAPNDSTAGAAIEALQARGLAGKVAVTGQDAELAAIRRIIQGTQSMTLFKDTRQSAKKTIDVAIHLANGEHISTNTALFNGKMYVPTVLIEPILIDKSNIDDVLIKSGYFTREEVYGS